MRKLNYMSFIHSPEVGNSLIFEAALRQTAARNILIKTTNNWLHNQIAISRAICGHNLHIKFYFHIAHGKKEHSAQRMKFVKLSGFYGRICHRSHALQSNQFHSYAHRVAFEGINQSLIEISTAHKWPPLGLIPPVIYGLFIVIYQFYFRSALLFNLTSLLSALLPSPLIHLIKPTALILPTTAAAARGGSKLISALWINLGKLVKFSST